MKLIKKTIFTTILACTMLFTSVVHAQAVVPARGECRREAVEYCELSESYTDGNVTVRIYDCWLEEEFVCY